VPSPDGTLDAVLLEGSSGAPPTFDYSIYIVKRGATLGRSPAVMYFDDARRGNGPHAVTLRWADSNDLAVEYLSAQKVNVAFEDIRLENRKIRITPRPGIVDPTTTAKTP